ncbi:MAG: OmpA family protein [Pseudomonadota bacterium]
MAIVRVIPFVLVLFVISACSTTNPYTGEKKTSNLAKGAGIGAAAGAVVGLISGDDSRSRKKNALIGAGIGAIAGGSVGYYMDVQEAKLREKLAGTGVSVTRDGDNIILNMPSNITFAVDSSDISSNFYAILNSVVIILKEYDKTLIEIMGHTDSTGSAEYNLKLSKQRADSVADYFRSQDILAARLTTYGYGKDYPVATNDTVAGRALNRRVEIVLVPLTKG